MKLLLTFILLTASLFAATSGSDRQRISELESKVQHLENSNTINLELHENLNITDKSQTDSIAKLLEYTVSIEKRIKILEKRKQK